MEKKKYRIADKNRADMRALMRGIVAVFLLYSAYQLCFRIQDATFPPVARVAAGAVLAIAAIGFGVFTCKRYRADCEDAVLTDEELEQLRGEQEE
ncbi:MAG: hypothetical protein NC319_00610 [Butyricicoccus sp.]|nr:hypothetical protein [Butyricicoccus sp.]